MRLLAASALLLAVACSPPAAPPVDAGDGVAPDWSLVDVNTASARSTQSVSPSDYRGKVSAWYFGHSG